MGRVKGGVAFLRGVRRDEGITGAKNLQPLEPLAELEGLDKV